jgi:hypothetical protein
MSKLQLRIYDGTRKLFSAPVPFLVTITDGNRIQRFRNYCQNNEIDFDLPFFDNLGDNYTVVVWAKGFKQAGFAPVSLSEKYVRTLDIMLISETPGFSFVNARWDNIRSLYPFIGSDVDNASGAARYDDLLDKREQSLASLLNLCDAMSQIHLAQGTPLDYIKQLRWDAQYSPAQDRFFAWCDRRLIDQIKIAADARMFSPEINPGLFHNGATSSWKQIQFGEANVQLTFHEKDKMDIGGIDCVMVEPDIDYFRDLGAHAIFEVVPNAFTHSLSNPVDVYVLRWIAGRAAGVPEFAPKYTITS